MIRAKIHFSSGRELPGMFNPDVVREIFSIKAENWEKIANAHIDQVWVVVKDALADIASHTSNAIVSQRIIRHAIASDLEKKREMMTTKLQELLAPHRKCHPITYDPAFEDTVQHWEDDSGEGDDEDDRGQPSTEVNALRYVEAYYNVSLRTWIADSLLIICRLHCEASLTMSPSW
jgi:hypothetical protein